MTYMSPLVVVGNVGNDPVSRYTNNGTQVTNFNIAHNRRWTNQDGSPGEQVIWIRCAAFGRLAEIAQQFLKKGMQAVTIEGELMPDTSGNPKIFNLSDGSPASSYEVRVNHIGLPPKQEEG